MERLRKIQQYLEARAKAAAHGTIFDYPNKHNAFPYQFLQTPQGEEILSFGDQIEKIKEAVKSSKLIELQNKMVEYEDLSFRISQSVCACIMDANGQRLRPKCPRCRDWGRRAWLKIQTYEESLPPEGDTQRAAILLELKMPEFLARYRNATWRLRILGCPEHKPKEQTKGEQAKREDTTSPTAPAVMFNDFLPLKIATAGFQTSENSCITMASTKKSFHKTHYKEKHLPTTADQVILPFGPIFEYYDSKSNLWTSEVTSYPSFEHILGQWLPEGLNDPFERVEDFAACQVYKPSSYEIETKKEECPVSLSAHEFTAYQRALTGRGRRWPVMVVELGATNVKLCSFSAMQLFNHLALQAGPRRLEKGDLRESHAIFEDAGFCRRLCDQINVRMGSIARSWREVYCASILITFALRLWHIGNSKFKDSARRLLSKMRQNLSRWILHLRNEVRTSSDSKTVENAVKYGLYASLLCRQTFSILLTDPEEPARLTRDDLMHYFRASIAMQENLQGDLSQLEDYAKLLLKRDLCTAFAMRHIHKAVLLKDGFVTLQRAIDETWSESRARHYDAWTFPDPFADGHCWWLTTLAGSSENLQNVHYHILYGHLLIDDEPLGRLPPKMSKDPDIRELFGNCHLLTRSSSLHGMKYQLGSLVGGHEVHFGEVAGKVVIQARIKDRVLQFIPRRTFTGSDGHADLPSSLLDDNVHWLDLRTGSLDIRRKPNIWKEKRNNWKVDVRNRLVHRNFDPAQMTKTGSFLVRADCEVATQITKVFLGFEDTRKLTIYFANNRIYVEMKRLELAFFVNKGGWLECKELGAEIRPEQDPGCLYGFESAIVLTSTSNKDNKSLMIAMGSVITTKRFGMHTKVHTANVGQYVRFMINPILGRLDCPAEPILLYTKALLHLLTSFPLPDPLTERTGIEEAMHCLSSATSQPWKPLSPGAINLLETIRSYAPARTFYPDNQEVCQRVRWSSDVTMSIQHDGLAPLVDHILLQSRHLASFEPAKNRIDTGASPVNAEIEHLSRRGLVRRQTLERHCNEVQSLIPDDTTFSLAFDPRSLALSDSNEIGRAHA
jgi:hypothetical protein